MKLLNLSLLIFIFAYASNASAEIIRYELSGEFSFSDFDLVKPGDLWSAEITVRLNESDLDNLDNRGFYRLTSAVYQIDGLSSVSIIDAPLSGIGIDDGFFIGRDELGFTANNISASEIMPFEDEDNLSVLFALASIIDDSGSLFNGTELTESLYVDLTGLTTSLQFIFRDLDTDTDYQLLGTINNYQGTMVPLPAAVWLFGTGLVYLFGLKKYS